MGNKVTNWLVLLIKFWENFQYVNTCVCVCVCVDLYLRLNLVDVCVCDLDWG